MSVIRPQFLTIYTDDVERFGLAGAHIVTVPPQFFPKMCQHPKTDEAVAQFVGDFREWMS